jgi:putative SOS response-associated peptidase YedK
MSDTIEAETGCYLSAQPAKPPLFAFAGILTGFKGDRGTKSKPIPGPHLVYGFLTTEANAVVEPIHPEGNAGDPDD